MGDSLEAAVVSFSTGLLFVTAIAILRKDVRAGFVQIFKAVNERKMPPWTLAAGALGASFVAMQTYVVPIAGVALFTVASLAGQTGISLWVDKLALSGGAETPTAKTVITAAITRLLLINVLAPPLSGNLSTQSEMPVWPARDATVKSATPAIGTT